MLTLPPSVRIFLAAGVTDLRKSFDGLEGIARHVIEQDPLSGHLFVFCNRRRNRLKILVFDGSGYWVLAKRLERGTFNWPARTGQRRRMELRAAELSLLLGGLDVATTRRPWYERKKS